MPGPDDDVVSLMTLASEALYRAKQHGVSQVEVVELART